MKILFDHQTFSYERFGVISRYFSQLIKHFQENPDCDVELSLKYSDNIYLKTLYRIDTKPFFNNTTFNKKPAILNILNFRNSIRHLQKQQFDVFHPTFYNPYFLKHIGSKPFVLTVHDMITEIFPGMFPGQAKISAWKINLIHKADRIIAESENTRQDIVRLCGINENKVDVVYLGTSLHDDVPKNTPIPHLPETYLLYVGKRSFYKNFNRFIRAVSRLLVMDNKLHLICAGSTNFTRKEKKLFKELEISDKMLHYPADDRLLATLYRNALAFVFPSLYEGFGIPIVEAFSCGCPAIISKTSSLPEIGGKAVTYFDPEDETSIQQAVKKVIYDKSLRNILRQEGFARVRKFTWKQTALNTLKIYKNL